MASNKNNDKKKLVIKSTETQKDKDKDVTQKSKILDEVKVVTADTKPLDLSKYADVVGEKEDTVKDEKTNNKANNNIKDLSTEEWKKSTINQRKEYVTGYLTSLLPSSIELDGKLLKQVISEIPESLYETEFVDGCLPDYQQYYIMKVAILVIMVHDLDNITLPEAISIVSSIPRDVLLNIFKDIDGKYKAIPEEYEVTLISVGIDMNRLKDKYRTPEQINAVAFLKNKLSLEGLKNYKDIKQPLNAYTGSETKFNPESAIGSIMTSLPMGMIITDNCPVLNNTITLLTMDGMTNEYFARLIKIQLAKYIVNPTNKDVAKWISDNNFEIYVESVSENKPA